MEQDDPKRELKLPAYQYYCSAEEILERARLSCGNISKEKVVAAIEYSHLIAESCRVEIPKGKPISFPGLPEGESPDQALLKIVTAGFLAKEAAGYIGDRDAYWQRAMREYQVLCSKGFSDYMLAIMDVVRHIRSQGGLVVLRGSAGGSLLLWLTDCSTTDPIRFDLSFERFYDETRPDPPDVDIDFEQSKRPEAIEYIFEKYGRENCSQIAGLSQLKAKGAMQDVCFALNIPRSEFAQYSQQLSDDATPTEVLAVCASLINKYPLLNVIHHVIGQYRQTTVHAAGVLVSSEPLWKAVGIMLGSDKQPVASVDKKGAADLGLLKMDFLSVLALDIVAKAVRSINLSTGKTENDFDWLYNMPLNDPRVFETADKGLLTGVFQLDGNSAGRAAKEIKVSSFDDLVAASVLCRPGPIVNIPVYARNKQLAGDFETYLAQFNPKVVEIIRPTYGVLMFQEQVMKIAEKVAGLPMKDVHRLRKDVGNKVGLDPLKGDAWRAEWSTKFAQGCIQHSGMSEAEAMFWWQSVETHGGYSFNKSHGVAYGVVGYWMLWLKTYWPAVFYESYLSMENSEDLMKRLILEFQSNGGKVKFLDPVHSKECFSSSDPNTLVGGFVNIKGVGSSIATKVSSQGPFGSVEEMLAAFPKAIGEKVRETAFWTDECNPQKLIALAPWMPVPYMPRSHQDAVRQASSILPSELATGVPTECCVGGYITYIKVAAEKVVFLLEDGKAGISCRVAKNRVKALVPKFKQLKSGDLVIIAGWWSGDCLFATEPSVLKSI